MTASAQVQSAIGNLPTAKTIDISLLCSKERPAFFKDLANRYFDCHSLRSDILIRKPMFIRFATAEIDRRSQVAAGLFCAVSHLRWAVGLPEYEYDVITELSHWFDIHLESPFDHLPRARRFERAICWFKPTASEHLARAWELTTILDRNDVLIWTIKARRTGYVHYEDEAQVFAEPYHDVRRLV